MQVYKRHYVEEGDVIDEGKPFPLIPRRRRRELHRVQPKLQKRNQSCSKSVHSRQQEHAL